MLDLDEKLEQIVLEQVDIFSFQPMHSRYCAQPHLVLGLISQIIKIQLLVDLNLKKTPQLVELVEDDKDVEELISLAPEKVLLKWMNFHLKKAGYEKQVTNFFTDIKNPELLSLLIVVPLSYLISRWFY